MGLLNSIRWAILFEKQLNAFPNFSSAQLLKAKNLKDAHIDRVNQEVYNRIDGKILSFSKAEKAEIWSKFLEFLACLGWEKDAFLFKELFEIEMTLAEKNDLNRKEMILKGIKNDKINNANADKVASGFKYMKAIVIAGIIILGIVYWEIAVGILGLLFLLALFFGLLSLVMPRAGSLFRLFLIWRYW